ncbi:MAG: LysR family transcriptional regulator [Solirubrobacteraceae bacterium]|nr:LysR family transcriptional regulator [Patulibacter sp.]
MNLRHLETFLAVAETSSFSRAADRLHVVQSAVSAGIRSLERELGAPLFARGPRGADLTDAGRALVPEARATLAAATVARDAVRSTVAGVTGSVTLGIMQSMRPPAPNVASVLAAFGRSHPRVDVRVRHGGGSLMMAEQIADGRLDLGFLSAVEARSDLDLIPLSRQPIQFACSTEHPLADRASIDLDAVAGEVWADLPRRWGTRELNDHAFAAAGATRSIAYEINDTSTLVEFVRHGLAVTMLPQSLIGDREGIASIPVDRHQPTFEISIASPANRRQGPAARALLEEILTAHPPLGPA